MHHYFFTLHDTRLVLSEPCNDDENWIDPNLIKAGVGTIRCVDLTYDLCRNSVVKNYDGSYYYDYYTEVMSACPKSCGLCK